jgi:hypothetical protein
MFLNTVDVFCLQINVISGNVVSEPEDVLESQQNELFAYEYYIYFYSEVRLARVKNISVTTLVRTPAAKYFFLGRCQNEYLQKSKSAY